MELLAIIFMNFIMWCLGGVYQVDDVKVWPLFTWLFLNSGGYTLLDKIIKDFRV
jgi:hypothetical protein